MKRSDFIKMLGLGAAAAVVGIPEYSAAETTVAGGVVTSGNLAFFESSFEPTEYLSVICDSLNRVVFAVKKDGTMLGPTELKELFNNQKTT